MYKILYLPLDERPCNWTFPREVFNNGNISIIPLPDELKGYKKNGTDVNKVLEFVRENSNNVDGLVISLDMLIYGGLIPSRLHYKKTEELIKVLSVLKEVKDKNPRLIIFGFSTIMRAPSYSSSDEEHDYYATYGRNIYDYGCLSHKKDLGIISETESKLLNSLNIPKTYLDDFVDRRKINLEVNLEIINYVQKGVIDFLVIPQDDSGEYGFTALDQEEIRKKLLGKNLSNKVYLYPGADEVGSILLARMINKLNNLRPKIYIKYPGPTCKFITPLIEDRFLDVTVRYQILAANGLVVTSLTEADAVLYVHAAADKPLTSLVPTPPTRGVSVLLNTVEAFEFLEYVNKFLKKPIIIADVTYDNGSNIECFTKLSLKDMVFDLAAYAGWNTSSNTIGSAVAMGMGYLNFGKTDKHLDLLVTRYLEDIAFGGYVRQIIWYEKLPNLHEYSYYDTKEQVGFISNLVKEEIDKFVREFMPKLLGHYRIEYLGLPWMRLYEVDLKAKYLN
ncbi:MAG: DUF4127 family protein [Bacilli bacterium]